jgi:hypothetical protein
MEQVCECCFRFNNSKSLSWQYKYACVNCVDEGVAEECDSTGHFRIVLECSGRGCYRVGPANYGDNLSEPEYYCGGSYSCCP